MTRLSIYRWLRDLFAQRAKDAFLEKYHHDRKCPHCQTWISEVDGAQEVKQDELQPDLELMLCRKCNKWSQWFYAGPIVVCLDVEEAGVVTGS